MSTPLDSPPLPTSTTFAETATWETSIPSQTSSPRRSVPSVTYLYGIVLVVVILTVFVCVCTAREVIRRQARADWQRNLLVIPDPGEDEEEEPKPKMVRPQMFDVYIKEIGHHGLDEYAKCRTRWYGVQPVSASVIPFEAKRRSNIPEPPSRESVKTAMLQMLTRSPRKARQAQDNLLANAPAQASSAVLTSVFITMPTPPHPRSRHTKRPSFAMSELSGEVTLCEPSGPSEEILFGIHEEPFC